MRLAVLFMLVATVALAQPQISGVSGEIANGESVTIYGSGFGSKASPGPVYWDRLTNNPEYVGLEHGDALPSRDTHGSSYTWGLITSSVTYNTQTPRTTGGATYLANGSGSQHWGPTIANADRLYLNWWIRLSTDDYGSQSNKVVRVWPTDQNLGWISWTTYHWTRTVDADHDCIHDARGVSGGGGANPTANTWHNLEYLIDNEGHLCGYGVLTRMRDRNVRGTNEFFSSAPIGLLRQFGHDCSVSSNCTGDIMSWTDVYVDRTWSRVMIGVSPTMAANNAAEIQIPTAWSSSGNEITFTVNAGTLTVDSTAYLFVYDSDNNRSPGFEITIGGVAEAELIGPPGTPVVSEVYE